MSKLGYISRYMLIIKKLKVKPYSNYEELKNYIENQLEYLQDCDDSLEIGFSKRTLQRDISDIKTAWGIGVTYSKTEKGYYIQDTNAENMNFRRMMEAFDLFQSLNIANDLSPYIHFEKSRPQGTENLYGLLHAIKNRLQVRFTYHKFWEEEASQRIGSPYALKEFKNRWYILVKDNHDDRIKTFALDRLAELEITNKKFTLPRDLDICHYFRYSYGITRPDNAEPEKIILSFEPLQGKYIKTLPLHDTQQILTDTEDELQIKLNLYITHDLVMELMSYGDAVKVLQPPSLAEVLRTAHKNAIGAV